MSSVRPSYLLAHQARVDGGEASVVKRGAQPPHRRRRRGQARWWRRTRRRQRCRRETESGHVVQTPREDGADAADGDHEEIMAHTHMSLPNFFLFRHIITYFQGKSVKLMFRMFSSSTL